MFSERGNIMRIKVDGKARKMVISNIKYYREKANIDDKDLSIKLGRKENFIEKLENDEWKIEPTLNTMALIAREIGIPIELLVKERDDDHE